MKITIAAFNAKKDVPKTLSLSFDTLTNSRGRCTAGFSGFFVFELILSRFEEIELERPALYMVATCGTPGSEPSRWPDSRSRLRTRYTGSTDVGCFGGSECFENCLIPFVAFLFRS